MMIAGFGSHDRRAEHEDHWIDGPCFQTHCLQTMHMKRHPVCHARLRATVYWRLHRWWSWAGRHSGNGYMHLEGKSVNAIYSLLPNCFYELYGSRFPDTVISNLPHRAPSWWLPLSFGTNKVRCLYGTEYCTSIYLTITCLSIISAFVGGWSLNLRMRLDIDLAGSVLQGRA